MPPRLPSSLIRSHGSLLRPRLQQPSGTPKPPAPRPRLSHSLPSPNARHSDRRLGFVREELQSLIPITSPCPKQVREWVDEEAGGGRAVEISHPWPEWVELMERLIKKGYLDRSVLRSASKDSNHIRTACLNFARGRFDLIRYFSRRDIQIIVGSGCPSLDRKVVNSGKRLRAHVGIAEGDVCSSCNLRGSCERAYVKTREDEGGRTVDVMRILLTYGLDLITTSVENQACLSKIVKGSVRNLLNEMVELSVKEIESTSPIVASGRDLSGKDRASGHQMPKGPNAVPLKQGDWICPKCNFLNFAKNVKCLRCNGVFEERLKKLHEDCQHLPLKKGDWICEKCNFLNFAKNTKCLQCHEKPPKRQLNPGEWECASCNYINFRRNMVCLKCDWKRPKASYSGDITAESHHGKQEGARHPGITSTRNSSDTKVPRSFRQSCLSQEGDTDFWSSDEDRGDNDDDNDDDFGTRHKFDLFDKFPIVGGKGATSQDPLAREGWKEEMLRRSRVFSGESSNENSADLSFSSFCGRELDESSGDDEIAGWFRCERGKILK